jgi:hypothetical protein
MELGNFRGFDVEVKDRGVAGYVQSAGAPQRNDAGDEVRPGGDCARGADG